MTTFAAPAARLAALRALLAEERVDAFIIPMADEHQSEYIPPASQRLAWVTGFTGSAGTAIVLAERAALFVDGRYTLQAAQEVDGALFERHHLLERPPEHWLADEVSAGSRVGYDPRLHTPNGIEKIGRTLARSGAELVPLDPNPVDRIWSDRPAPPLAPAIPHPEEYAGEASSEKRARLAEALAARGAAASVITAPDSIAWLLNIRGSDVAHTPIALSNAILHADGRVDWFLAPAKVSTGLEQHLGPAVARHDPEAFGPALDALGKAGLVVEIDPAQVNAWVAERLGEAGAEIRHEADPCLRPKAVKNEVELAGMRDAHRRDGAAMTRFLAWLAGAAREGGVTEIVAAERLRAFRSEAPEFRDESFETISGAGPNGAIVHYRVSETSNRALEPGSLYLVDSGAQYIDGTTDITRTVAIGAPNAEQRRHFTLVLKGHIALATARFPVGTHGGQLDALAREALWREGLDYDHGTGHGVGCYLGVHEGPARISKSGGGAKLEPGMVLSNEPGYYREGVYGIRIENLLAVIPWEGSAERPFLAFETLTLAPIDRNLIATELLSRDEIDWINGYHRRVAGEIGPLLSAEAAEWLDWATRPIA